MDEDNNGNISPSISEDYDSLSITELTELKAVEVTKKDHIRDQIELYRNECDQEWLGRAWSAIRFAKKRIFLINSNIEKRKITNRTAQKNNGLKFESEKNWLAMNRLKIKQANHIANTLMEDTNFKSIAKQMLDEDMFSKIMSEHIRVRELSKVNL